MTAVIWVCVAKRAVRSAHDRIVNQVCGIIKIERLLAMFLKKIDREINTDVRIINRLARIHRLTILRVALRLHCTNEKRTTKR